jgi:hypothetical protein
MNAEVLLRGVSLSKEFDCQLGDKRRRTRLQRVAETMSRRPEQSFPNMMEGPAEQEAFYRLLRNEALTFENVLEGHLGATAERCCELTEVLVVHDTTEFTFRQRDGHRRLHLAPKSNSSQAFHGHVGIAVSADGLRAPMGCAHFQGYVHHSQVEQETIEFWSSRFGSYKSEGERWVSGMEASEKRLQGVRVIHVADREADRNDVFQWGCEGGSQRGFVIRSHYKRVDAAGRRIQEVLDDEPFIAKRRIKLSARSLQGVPLRSKTFPQRAARAATVSFRACSFELKPQGQPTLLMNAVEVIELAPPTGQEPVHWILLTGEPIDSLEAVLRIVDIYRSRWLIEEYFKAIKTGCAFEKRQLDSAQTLLVALALTLPVAWTLLALRHLSRHAETEPAGAVLSPFQIRLLVLHLKELKWSKQPTVGQVCRGIARLGGHHRSNGPPGWQILGRGYQKLLTMEMGARIAVQMDL